MEEERSAGRRFPSRHGVVIDSGLTAQMCRTFLASPAVVGVARDLVVGRARAWGLETLRHDLVAVVAELVGNAVEVSRRGEVVKVSLRRDRDGVVVAVWDGSNEQLKPRRVELSLEAIDALPEYHDFGGWGLSIVEQLSDCWGVDRTPPAGKWVWSRIPGSERRS